MEGKVLARRFFTTDSVVANHRVGLSGSEAIRLIKQGKTGNNYVWDHLSLLVGMLR
jgi:hypothetical protein